MIKKHTQNKVDEPGPQLVVEPPPQGQFPLSGISVFTSYGIWMSLPNCSVMTSNISSKHEADMTLIHDIM